MSRILNVGGGGDRSVPERYAGWELHVLDIDPAVQPDICADARDLASLPAAGYQAVICSHALEHFYRHEVPGVLAGFRHVLTEDGRADIVVPNLPRMFEALRAGNLDITDVWYRTGAGVPITFHDVLYGWNHAMANGNLYYAHKSGWSGPALGAALTAAGFKGVRVWEDATNLYAAAFVTEQGSVPCP